MNDEKIKYIGDEPTEIGEISTLLEAFGGKKNKLKLYEFLLGRIDAISSKTLKRDEKLMGICHLLSNFAPNIDWVGFYIKDQNKKDELVLGPYEGEPTEHTNIPFGKGICGQVAVTEEIFDVPDVKKEENYLSCSPDVKAEIVLPIIKSGEFVAELDIDSHVLSPFDNKDKEFLKKVTDIAAKIF